ncbi:MAG TPA: hypothetical protein VFM10_03475 [Terriglobales bacterium]|nr:hypothetical protein [Terriglobales bacterium]
MNTKAVLLGLLLLSITMYGQNRCMPITATGLMTHQLVGGDWTGTVTVTFGGQSLEAGATIVTVSGPELKGTTANAASGSELATFTFTQNDWFQVLSHFDAQHMTNPDLVFHVNEAGKITAGSGIFQGVTGATNHHGPFWIDTTEGVIKSNMNMRGTICWK